MHDLVLSVSCISAVASQFCILVFASLVCSACTCRMMISLPVEQVSPPRRSSFPSLPRLRDHRIPTGLAVWPFASPVSLCPFVCRCRPLLAHSLRPVPRSFDPCSAWRTHALPNSTKCRLPPAQVFLFCESFFNKISISPTPFRPIPPPSLPAPTRAVCPHRLGSL
ncbi:uncharacterized protein BJ171DRAFT_202089 [Polychytrium aggregatum]|uniref:uncharacterized protein n=1 Tax=Polychytrium aggregatum TaxID=110093 RepID=UPI0022FE3258|nr:uncharacterized protein BJ171DRAFT_202089 [Polychytrium aggregatum]KAI9199750.1 hypothetical protein BJ171DRAFT_202089 [Polychytrium aggregatum]